MEKIDYKKELKHFYRASAKEVVEVELPPLRYLMVDGEGDPNTSPGYAQAVEALFTVSYTAKFAVKKATGTDYSVMPLEGLWWAKDWSAFEAGDRQNWLWTMMILQPPFATDAVIDGALAQVARKKQLPALAKLRLEVFAEGRCAQILHVGPFTEEGPTIARLHEFIEARSGLAGKHHEIYLSDVRRADPKKWKTILRQGMREHLSPTTC
ncbi:MAG: GyrI-like domain-containing protein [Chthoniobacterales bacterium]